ncbi:MAG TPA: hypothetical protein VKT99_21695 [Xanthobacteraceae bacterium]|jgi:hypothetical protein|nr:hypothetical protein [Xanthobacteraceae bacterium]
MNNSAIFAADRNTHIKILGVALVASIAVVLVGMTARSTTVADPAAGIHAAGPPVKAGKPIAVSHIETTTIR